jgi:hypothetical protein
MRLVGRGETGAGILGAVVGVTMFLVLLLFAVQVLVGLYAKSVVTAVTYDAAKNLAGTDQGDTAARRAAAEDTARRQLGRMGQHTTFDWRGTDPDTVRLTVRARRPTVVPRSLVDSSVLGTIERTVQVRMERVR